MLLLTHCTAADGAQQKSLDNTPDELYRCKSLYVHTNFVTRMSRGIRAEHGCSRGHLLLSRNAPRLAAVTVTEGFVSGPRNLVSFR
jgi:hypothetical protein